MFKCAGVLTQGTGSLAFLLSSVMVWSWGVLFWGLVLAWAGMVVVPGVRAQEYTARAQRLGNRQETGD